MCGVEGFWRRCRVPGTEPTFRCRALLVTFSPPFGYHGGVLATVVVAPAIARWLTASPGNNTSEKTFAVPGGTLRDVLESLFAQCPTLRGYIVDDHGTMRHHVVAFVNGTAIRDKQTLADPVPPESEVYIFQALSGG